VLSVFFRSILHNKLILVALNKLIVIQHNKLILAQHNKLERQMGHGKTFRKTG